MTLTLEHRSAGHGPRPVIQRPGAFEMTMVPLTMFILVYRAPDGWFYDPGATDDGKALTTALQILLPALAFLRVAGNLDLVIRVIRLEPLLALYAMLSVCSIFWTVNLALTLRESFLITSVYMWATYLVLRFELPQILKLLAISAIPGTLLNLLFVVALPQYGRAGSGDAWTGVFGQKNALGYTATVFVPLLVIVAGFDRPRRFLYYGAAVLNVILLIGSESKTMLVATLLPILLLFVYHGFRGRKTLRGAVIISFVAATVIMTLFVTANLGFFAAALEKDVTLTGRTDLWADLIPIAAERPVLGWGMAAPFNGYFSPVHEVWIQNRWSPTHAHNAILQTWLELGVVGVLLFVAVFLRAVKRSIEVVRVVPGRIGLWPLSFLTTTLLISISESGIVNALPSYLLFILCVWSASLLRQTPLIAAADPSTA